MRAAKDDIIEEGRSEVDGRSPSIGPLADVLERRVAAARRAWSLTTRQAEVVRQLALGDTNKDIADWLGMSPRTVEQHVAAVLLKAGSSNRSHLVARFWTQTSDARQPPATEGASAQPSNAARGR